ncbi:hypothetical protein M378DRAFT_163645 [Amanita muscaria Koide BX008]|uniref:Uncharacterized protein n=1 Tax=Amanita muscaria (strain Koide BX008) TaxID=946122 RepID=A0A0C2TBR3_AMAMK|nr:hypothetical protein M378DRAFT_163645 [Amanita muscaria Koide BX008]
MSRCDASQEPPLNYVLRGQSDIETRRSRHVDAYLIVPHEFLLDRVLHQLPGRGLRLEISDRSRLSRKFEMDYAVSQFIRTSD